jgi:hypothetical protein
MFVNQEWLHLFFWAVASPSQILIAAACKEQANVDRNYPSAGACCGFVEISFAPGIL